MMIVTRMMVMTDYTCDDDDYHDSNNGGPSRHYGSKLFPL